MKPQKPISVKLFIGVLYSNRDILSKALDLLEKEFGPVDFKIEDFEFTVSDYYVEEMGRPIYRSFYSFERLIDPSDLVSIKLKSNEIEDLVAVKNNRKVNLDPGYLDYDKVVLASAKYNGNKVYLDKGIWADLTLFYSKGKFTPYPWSFPDFKLGLYDTFFLEMRSIYKKQRRII